MKNILKQSIDQLVLEYNVQLLETFRENIDKVPAGFAPVQRYGSRLLALKNKEKEEKQEERRRTKKRARVETESDEDDPPTN